MRIWSSLRRRLAGLNWLAHPAGLRDQIAHMERHLQSMQAQLATLHRQEMSRAWVGGHHMRVDPDDNVVSSRLRELGWFEPFETRLIQRLVSPGDTIVDVGANIGYYTLQLARLVGNDGRVFAFEPDPRNFDFLQRNVWQNGYGRQVTLVQAAVTARAEQVRLHLNPDNHGDHRIYPAESDRQSIAVDAVSLDEWFRGHGGRIALVKIDVQGAEGAVFEGMRGLVAAGRIGRIVTEFWPRGLQRAGCDAREFLDRRAREGFRIRVIDEGAGRAEPLDADALLARLPAAQDTDWLFTNLLLEHESVEPVEMGADASPAGHVRRRSA